MKLLKENKYLLVLTLLCMVAIIAMIVALCIPKQAQQASFTPPSFDEKAVVGDPIVPDDLGYGILYRQGMSFKVGICGNIYIHNDSADVYLTNMTQNNVWLKVRIYDSNGKMIGESGLLKPGEYLKSVSLQEQPTSLQRMTLKIMSYEPDTYHSLGAITITPQILVNETT